MRGAVVDFGSCTFHAVIADVDEYGIRKVVFDRKRSIRIVEDFSAGAEAMGDLLRRVAVRSATARVIATGVFRERADLRALLENACKRHRLVGEVIESDEEGRLTWLGVSTELAGSHRKLAVLDLGASALSLVTGEYQPVTRSLPLGVMQLRATSPLEARGRVLSLVEPYLDELRTADTVALASGTARALLALGRRVGLISDSQHHVGARTFKELARMLPLAPERLAALGVPESRRDTITAGAIVIATLLELLGKPVVYVARSALREGALVDLAHVAARDRHVRTPHASPSVATTTACPT